MLKKTKPSDFRETLIVHVRMGEVREMNRAVTTAGMIWLLVGLASSSRAAPPDAGTRPEKLFFESGGRKIRADRYAPAGTRSGRTIIVLYGAGGMVFDGPSMKRVARSLADKGDTVYLLHYYNRTGTVVAFDSTMQKHFAESNATTVPVRL